MKEFPVLRATAADAAAPAPHRAEMLRDMGALPEECHATMVAAARAGAR